MKTSEPMRISELKKAVPRVTVSIPTYNRAHLLRGAIQSVLDQSLRGVEIFVSDNASTDDTPAVVAEFGDARLHYVRNDTNVGPLANMSLGLRLGSAPFITVLPDDDIMLPGNLERKVRLLEEHAHVGMVHSAIQFIHIGPNDEVRQVQTFLEGGPVDRIVDNSVFVRQLLTETYWVSFPGTIMRRSVVGQDRFDEADGMADDLGLMLRIAHKSNAVAYIAEPLVSVRIHPGARSAQERLREFESQSDAYLGNLSMIAHFGDAKQRFLSQYGHELEGLPEMRNSVRRWVRRRLLELVAERSRLDRSPFVTLRLLRTAAKIEPTVLFTRRAARLFAMSLAGSRGRRVARRFFSQTRSDRPK